MSAFKSVNTPSNNIAGESNGLMQIVRGSKFITIDNGAKSEAPLERGLVLTGVFGGTEANKFDETKVNYKLRAEDGTLIILSENASLKQQFAKVSEGELLQITYNGKRAITRKNGAKTEMHDYDVARAVEAE